MQCRGDSAGELCDDDVLQRINIRETENRVRQ